MNDASEYLPTAPEHEPPHAIEAEQSIISCVFQSPHDCIPECVARIPDGARSFYDPRHGIIYGAFAEMDSERTKVDFISIVQRLRDKRQIEAAGGHPYLEELKNLVPSTANIGIYIDLIVEKWTLRKTLIVCNDTIRRIYEGKEKSVRIIDGFESGALSVRRSISDDEQQEAKPLVHEAINDFEVMHSMQGKLRGISTGFPDLDRKTWGLQKQNLIYIAARPSLGKTSFAMNIADAVAVDQGLPVGVFSLEMSKEELIQRQICARARVNIRDLRDGLFQERDFPKITTAAGKIANSPLIINDRAGINILELRAKARRMWQQYGIKLFIIDYLGKIHGHSKKSETNRAYEISEVSNGIKEMAKELDVPVIVLAQLNRDVDKRKTPMPMMSDLRESGAIEQDGDLIGFLWRKKDDEDDTPTESSDSIETNLLIAKQRNGPVGNVPLTFFRQYTRFESAAKLDEPPPQH